MANWSELPVDVIVLFADRLPYLKDLVRFGSVSKSWRSASIQAKTRRKSSDLWLVMAKRENDKISDGEDGQVRGCYSFSSNKVFDLSLPELQGRRCWGTQYGWIITLGLDSDYHLFNPLTRARYSLPHRSTFRDQGSYEDNEHMCVAFPGNFALSSNPSDSGESVVVMAMYAGLQELAYASPKDKSWTCLETANNTQANHDAIFFKDRFYSITVRGVLRMCDINASEPKTVNIAPPLNLDCCGTKLYLAEILGELHLIVRYFNYVNDDDNYEDHHLETISFNLYKFDFHGIRWTEVRGFENHSLFVGNNTTFAISTSDYLDFNFKLNCIYFTDDQVEYFVNRFCDMGVYDIGMATFIEPFYKQEDLPSKFSRPFLFMCPFP